VSFVDAFERASVGGRFKLESLRSTLSHLVADLRKLLPRETVRGREQDVVVRFARVLRESGVSRTPEMDVKDKPTGKRAPRLSSRKPTKKVV
jgi:hypothetical protein